MQVQEAQNINNPHVYKNHKMSLDKKTSIFWGKKINGEHMNQGYGSQFTIRKDLLIIRQKDFSYMSKLFQNIIQ